MQRWEYLRIRVENSHHNFAFVVLDDHRRIYVNDLLVQLGNAGWELVSAAPAAENITQLYLKRPKHVQRPDVGQQMHVDEGAKE